MDLLAARLATNPLVIGAGGHFPSSAMSAFTEPSAALCESNNSAARGSFQEGNEPRNNDGPQLIAPRASSKLS
jgi:hypothetical protein